ncbi:Protein CBG27565 [Caenorhabditis briggsae]|uniref:Protein CBG27565 n=1 Tax=Caenorhabditis briggsae TaxID=6238 RepID=B6IKM8_CAEBR|nr:Protein CBG27565 [Caenorhabditis briggsae]CAS00458.1 Protein CBG27565 [Caenorhabditis briggsae]
MQLKKHRNNNDSRFSNFKLDERNGCWKMFSKIQFFLCDTKGNEKPKAELIKDAAAGELCNDRNVSKGYVNPKLEFRDTKTKGYGIFAKEDISSGEFLAEYAGELIVVWKEGNLASIKGTQ